MVQPYFDYCPQVWMCLGSTLCDKLRLQNRAARFITRCGYEVPADNLLKHLNLQKLEIRMNQQPCTLLYEIYHEMLPSTLTNLFMKVDQVHEYRITQSRYDFLPPKPNTNHKTKAISYRGAVAWNAFPNDPKSAATIQILKKIKNF